MSDNKEKLKKYERSELILFESRVYEELGDIKKAIEIITSR